MKAGIADEYKVLKEYGKEYPPKANRWTNETALPLVGYCTWIILPSFLHEIEDHGNVIFGIKKLFTTTKSSLSKKVYKGGNISNFIKLRIKHIALLRNLKNISQMMWCQWTLKKQAYAYFSCLRKEAAFSRGRLYGPGGYNRWTFTWNGRFSRLDTLKNPKPMIYMKCRAEQGFHLYLYSF